ncbi:MAG: type IV pilus assembly protein PilM [bacterium]
MNLLKPSSISYLGVDIGTSSIKLVELKEYKGKVVLVTYGYSSRVANDYTNVNKLNIKQTSEIIEDVADKADVSSTRNVIASLPTFTVFSSIIHLAGRLSKKDLDSAVQWEAKKVIPLPLSDIVLDWQQIGDHGPIDEEYKLLKKEDKKKKNEPASNKILITGAPKNLIKSYVYTFKNIKYGLISLETEVFGLIRSLLGNDKATTMIVQSGASSTNIFVVDKGVPVLSRSIDVGGLAITKAIAKSLNIDLDQAEQFKRDLNDDGTGLPKMVTDAISPILNEAKYILEVFSEKENVEIEKVILTGGTALLTGLSEYLSNILKINVVVGDPWFRIAYPMELKPVLKEVGPKLSVAAGLAMREFDRK